MPLADTASTAHAWATRRAIDVWVVHVDGFTTSDAAELAQALAVVKADGARVALVGESPVRDHDPLYGVADGLVVAPGAPDARWMLAAAWDVGATDVRRVGVLGAAVPALIAGHCAGSGAVVGVAPVASDLRRRLLAGQPDVIVGAEDLARLVAERWGSRRAHRERVLLNPGPTVVSDRVHRAISGPDLCHREVEYQDIAARVRAGLLRAANAPDGWEAVLLAGSGTAAMEAMVGGAVRPGRKLLVVRNGTYGDRLAMMAERTGIDHADVISSHTTPVSADAVAAALDADPAIDAIAVVHHETTTGLLNPVTALASLARDRGVLLAVDAISSLGAEELSLADGGIDVVAGTANKCLHGLPGVSFVLLSPKAIERVRAAVPRSLYLDLAGYLAAAKRGSVPFTPAVPAVYALDAALEELFDGGPTFRRQLYRSRMAFLDGELRRLGLEPPVAPEHRSVSVRAVPLPAGVTYAELHDTLKAAGYVVYAGQGSAAANQFRVCALGTVGIDALRGFIEELESVIAASVAVGSHA